MKALRSEISDLRSQIACEFESPAGSTPGDERERGDSSILSSPTIRLTH
jgi:hypothetical protein